MLLQQRVLLVLLRLHFIAFLPKTARALQLLKAFLQRRFVQRQLLNIKCGKIRAELSECCSC